MGLNIAVLANLKRNAPKYEGMSADAWDDLDSDVTIDAICAALRAGGHTATFLEGNLSLVEELPKLKPDLCFNICEGHWGDSRESHVPALLEMLRIPYTGSGVLTLALTLDKPMTKRVLNWHTLPTPAFQTFERADEPLDDDMLFPLFVKPAREGTGMGVTAQSIVNNEAELRERVAYTLDKYKQTALVERYISGREVTVGLVGNFSGPASRRLPARYYFGERTRDYSEAGLAAIRAGGITFLPPLEVNLEPYRESEAVYTNTLKTDLADKVELLCPAPLRPEQVQELNWLTAAVFRVLGCYDVSRIDFRLDSSDNDRPYILEINPLPGLAPGLSDLVLEAAAAGIGYTELINMILNAAIDRHDLRPSVYTSYAGGPTPA